MPTRNMTAPATAITFVDTHVHLHACFRIDRTFDAAWESFSALSRRWQTERWTGVLLLVEDVFENGFARLQAAAAGTRDSDVPGDWIVETTDDPRSVIATRPPDRLLVIVAGIQRSTREGIELLFPATLNDMAPGLPVLEAIECARETSGLALIPWGFGKWLGRRGRLITDIVEDIQGRHVLLADTGNRPSIFPEPKILERVRSSGFPVPLGSDPLPFSSEESRAGTFGCALRHELSRLYPSEGLLDALRDPTAYAGTFGTPERPLKFIRNQLGMQLRKRVRPLLDTR